MKIKRLLTITMLSVFAFVQNIKAQIGLEYGDSLVFNNSFYLSEQMKFRFGVKEPGIWLVDGEIIHDGQTSNFIKSDELPKEDIILLSCITPSGVYTASVYYYSFTYKAIVKKEEIRISSSLAPGSPYRGNIEWEGPNFSSSSNEWNISPTHPGRYTATIKNNFGGENIVSVLYGIDDSCFFELDSQIGYIANQGEYIPFDGNSHSICAEKNIETNSDLAVEAINCSIRISNLPGIASRVIVYKVGEMNSMVTYYTAVSSTDTQIDIPLNSAGGSYAIVLKDLYEDTILARGGIKIADYGQVVKDFFSKDSVCANTALPQVDGWTWYSSDSVIKKLNGLDGIVNLSASNGCTILTKHLYIKKADQIEAKIFYVSQDTRNPKKWHFSAIYNPNMSYKWDFGDGNSAMGYTVSHIYADTGSYQATLVVYNDCNSDSASYQITIEKEKDPISIIDIIDNYDSKIGAEFDLYSITGQKLEKPRKGLIIVYDRKNHSYHKIINY